jgi:hypothetical protein
MKNTTVRVIIILVALLFINIEAAHAGIIQRIKGYILVEFPANQMFFIIGLLLFLSFLSYVVFTPVLIGNQKWSWLSYYSYPSTRPDFKNKRLMIKKISRILNNEEISNGAHS